MAITDGHSRYGKYSGMCFLATPVKILAGLLLMLGSQGCTTINLVPEEGSKLSGVRNQLFVGALKVRIPESEGNIQAVDIKTLGVGWQKGPFLGWNASNLVTANPSSCQLLIIIRTPAEADNALKIISSLEGQNPCIVDYTSH
jgi:hypothetical protein